MVYLLSFVEINVNYISLWAYVFYGNIFKMWLFLTININNFVFTT